MNDAYLFVFADNVANEPLEEQFSKEGPRVQTSLAHPETAQG
jgi:hypothetical protein